MDDSIADRTITTSISGSIFDDSINDRTLVAPNNGGCEEKIIDIEPNMTSNVIVFSVVFLCERRYVMFREMLINLFWTALSSRLLQFVLKSKSLCDHNLLLRFSIHLLP